jgi:preprotein translocase SecE subunit
MFAVGLGLLILGLRYFVRPGFEEWLATFEEQGWFSAESYKKSQGVRVRRGTIVGILGLAGCGVWTLINHHSLDTVGHWALLAPFTNGTQEIIWLPEVRFTLPFLLIVGSLWLGWRLVNFPTFADFLIATEAELNKVSWTTRKRLFQDTIVVLVTLFLFTVFLAVIDVLWGWFLSREPVPGVLRTRSSQTETIDPQQTPW